MYFFLHAFVGVVFKECVKAPPTNFNIGNIADKDGVTPLRHARDKGFKEIVAILEKAGAK